jgi:hypothetical protein
VNLTGDYIWSAERAAHIPTAQGHQCCWQGRLSSWFVRLCVKSARFVTSGQYGGSFAVHRRAVGDRHRKARACFDKYGRDSSRSQHGPSIATVLALS